MVETHCSNFRIITAIFRVLEYLHFSINFFKCRSFTVFHFLQIGYRPGTKNTAAALKYVRKRMFVERYGDRDFAKNYVIMLTGEGASRDPFAAATEACQLQVHVNHLIYRNIV